MVTTPFTALRRIAGFALTLMLFSLCLTGEAAGQGASPLVTASFAAGLNHPTGWGTLEQTALDSYGDWLVVDYVNGALYEFPAGGGAMITLAAVGGDGSKGGYQNPAIVIDPDNNLYLGGNWNNCLLMFPYDTTTHTWDGLATLATTSGPNQCGTTPYGFAQYGISGYAAGYFQPWGIAIGNNDNLIIGNQNSGNFIFSLAVTGAWSSPVSSGVGTAIIDKMTARPNSVAQDPEGNIYFVEDAGGLSGAYEIPAGAGELASDASGVIRVDPTLPNVTGLITDSTGNLYISDGTDGVFLVPNPSGTPETASASLLTPVPAEGEVAIDWARNIMYVPTTQTQSNGQADVAEVQFGATEFGSSPVGTAASPAMTANFGFNGSATPANFVISEDGVTNPDFAITGGTCTTGVAYAADSGCVEDVTFTPNSVGSISAKLLMLDASNNVLSSIVLHGTGVGASVQTSPGVESAIGGGLKMPSQVAVDAMGNAYIADAGQGQVLMYPPGSGTSSTPVSIGTGLTAPTGVAVDGAGDVFIADSSNGSVYEVPYGPTGLNMAGQVTLATGLGANLNIAVDGLGNLYIADPSNNRVVKLSNVGASTSIFAQTETMLTSGFTTPSAVAVDSENNLYVVDGSNLFELMGGAGTPTSLLSSLSSATGLAVDPSGAVYITSSGATERIPSTSIGGTLVVASETALATDVNAASSVAIDRWGNVYLTATAGGSVDLLSHNGMLGLPTPSSLTSSTSATAIVTNIGNSTLSVSGYSSSNSIDFTAADGSCVSASPLVSGGTCAVDVTFDPGPGEQGALSGQIGIASNATNAPLTISATGTGLTLATAATSVTVGASAQVIDTPVTVTVTQSSGTVVPTGEVTVSYTSFTITVPSTGPTAGAPTITPVTSTATGTLSNGTASFNLAPVLAGSQTITVSYGGDRVYGVSTGTATAAVAKSAITGLVLDPTPPSYLPFILESDGSTPYDGSQTYFQYTMPVTVNTAAGIPTGTLTFMDNSATCPAGTSLTGQGAAICALTGYSGEACPASGSAAAPTISNSGTGPTGAQASFGTTCLPMALNTTYTPVISTHSITPVYSGDANFLPYTGPTPTLFQVVRSPAVIITSSPASVTLQAGSTTTTNLTLTSILGYGYAGKGATLNDYNFPLTLTCDNLPPHASCSFTYPSTVNSNQPSASNSVQVPCSGTTAAADDCLPGNVTMTIYSNVAVGTETSQIARGASVTLSAIFGFGMIGIFFRRKSFEKGRRALMVFLMIVGGALAVSLTACSTTNIAPGASLSTPSGSYAVAVTAEQVGYQCVAYVGPASNCTTSGGATGLSVYGSEDQVSVPFYVNVTVQ